LERGTVWLDEAAEGALVASEGTFEEPPVLGSGDDAGGFLDRE
jgi:hypothetical protein